MAIIAGAISVAVSIGYVLIMRSEGDTPVSWFLGGLIVAVILLGYGARRDASLRPAALSVAGAVLLGLGFLGLASIGLPLLVAAALAFVGAGRA